MFAVLKELPTNLSCREAALKTVRQALNTGAKKIVIIPRFKDGKLLQAEIEISHPWAGFKKRVKTVGKATEKFTSMDEVHAAAEKTRKSPVRKPRLGSIFTRG